jgi:hypothetical protein
MITPTVGRVIHVRNRHANPHKDQPEAALIVFVHDERRINVGGFDHDGMPFAMHGLVLWQEGDKEIHDLPYAAWMPYQTAVAKGEIPPVLHADPKDSVRGNDLLSLNEELQKGT